MKMFSLFLALLLLTNLDPVERFTYQQKDRLDWSDFKGVPPLNVHHFASVNSGMGYSFSSRITDGKLGVDVKVNSYFYPQLSWKKNIDENSQQLLKHEQLHWDISEVYTRKLRAAYKNYVPQKNPKKEVDFIFQKFEKERQLTQKKYDRESHHGLNKVAQQKWATYIAEELFKTSTEALAN